MCKPKDTDSSDASQMLQKGVFSTDMTESFEPELTRSTREVFLEGVHDGMPIALGYFVVSFTLGIAARNAGLDPLQGFLASFFNNASAGEYAGFTIIAADAPYLEIILITLVANARYMLMSCALSQKFQPGTSIWHRIFVGFDVTDEIFGITIARKGPLNPYYNYGAMALALPGWAVGTALGVVAGNILRPPSSAPSLLRSTACSSGSSSRQHARTASSARSCSRASR